MPLARPKKPIIVLRNGHHDILKSFAALADTPGGSRSRSSRHGHRLSREYGCDAKRLDDLEAMKVAAMEAWTKAKPTVLEIAVSSEVPALAA
jgi:benzoylformate decarboxylase